MLIKFSSFIKQFLPLEKIDRENEKYTFSIDISVCSIVLSK